MVAGIPVTFILKHGRNFVLLESNSLLGMCLRQKQKDGNAETFLLMQEAYLSLTTKTLVFLQHVTQQYEADFIMKVCRPFLVSINCTLFPYLLADRRQRIVMHLVG